MAEKTQSFVLRSKRGPAIVENGEPKRDNYGKIVYGEPIPVTTVELKLLTSREAMDADDFAVEISPTGRPSDDNRVRVFAACAVRKLNNEIILRPQESKDVAELIDQLSPDELMELGRAHLTFSRKVEDEDDPLPSSDAKP